MQSKKRMSKSLKLYFVLIIILLSLYYIDICNHIRKRGILDNESSTK